MNCIQRLSDEQQTQLATVLEHTASRQLRLMEKFGLCPGCALHSIITATLLNFRHTVRKGKDAPHEPIEGHDILMLITDAWAGVYGGQVVAVGVAAGEDEPETAPPGVRLN
jgi:hypothetical protein